MAQVRLRINMIVDGKLVPRGSVMDEANVPPNLRIPDYIDRDLEDRHGVLLLRDLSFMSPPRPMSDGVLTSFPVHVARGELFDLAQVPESKRRELIEGVDYREKWTFAEAEALRKSAEDIYASSDSLKAEPEIPGTPEVSTTAPWRSR